MFYIWLFHVSYLEYVVDAEATLVTEETSPRSGTCWRLYFTAFEVFHCIFRSIFPGNSVLFSFTVQQ